ncbi:UNVERIFIED_CONTAM: hypothetical protein RMT77_010000 [Armadillidium vulgare]|uniref:Dysbindin n=1 Tax=Armadillidium nasatum TaxID=96803 RepID=A0A5N5TCI5_9CRUS|nr:Dysbindin [Armadillidium nasatum]RXG52709.1 Dysbindin [Armadillidium vulgare]
MFEALRKNIQTVQEGITAGLQRLSVAEKAPSSSESRVDFTAGSDLLELYQTQWATMHHMANQNGQLAEVVDSKITKLMQECEKQHNQIIEIHSLLAHLPNIMSQLHSMLSTIGSVRGLFEEVEGEILTLEDLEEELLLQEKTLDMRLSLALARENTTHKLKQFRNDLSTSHQMKVKELEKKEEEKRKEKEKIYESQFLEDIKEYQARGTIKSISSEKSNEDVKLEDIELDEDRGPLESFLDSAD